MPVVPVAPSFPAFPPPTGSASGSTGGSTTGEGEAPAACPDYIRGSSALQTFTAPPIGSTGQLYSQCAYLWAAPGAALYVAQFGTVEIAGVSGDLITYRNLNIVPGTVIQAGTLLIQGIPAGESASSVTDRLTAIQGLNGSALGTLAGLANQLLRWNQIGSAVYLQATDGRIFVPNPAAATELTAEDSGGGALPGTGVTPIPDSSTSVVAYYDMPNLPASNLLPSTFFAHVHIRLSCANAASQTVSVKHNSVEIAALADSKVSHAHCILPVSGSRLQLTYEKSTTTDDRYARVWIAGYSF